MREADLPAKLHTRRSSLEELHRPKPAGPMLNQPAFDWKAPDRYMELLNSEMEVANILQTKAHDLDDEEKMLIMKNY